MRISGPVVPAGIPALCDRVASLLVRVGADAVVCDVTHLGPPDPAALDAVARIALTAHGLGRATFLSGACARLRDLLEVAGLDDVLPVFSP